MLNLAHRGYSSKYPENTMLAFKKAMHAGADGLELDVQLSKDGIAMVYHDETLNRLTEFSGYLCDFDAKVLSQMTIAGSDETMPTLEQLFNYFKANTIRVVYNIELKNSEIKYPQIERVVIDLIKRYNLGEDVIVSSFNHDSIKWIKTHYPEISCGILTGCYMTNITQYIKSIGAEYYHPYLNTVDASLCETLKREGIGINAWTGLDIGVKDIAKLDKYQLFGLITNYPERVR